MYSICTILSLSHSPSAWIAFFYRKWINCNFPLLFFVPQSDALDYEFTQNEIWIYRWNSHLLDKSLWWILISIYSEPWGVIILNVHIIIIAIKHYNLINICWIVASERKKNLFLINFIAESKHTTHYTCWNVLIVITNDDKCKFLHVNILQLYSNGHNTCFLHICIRNSWFIMTNPKCNNSNAWAVKESSPATYCDYDFSGKNK